MAAFPLEGLKLQPAATIFVLEDGLNGRIPA